MRGQEFAKREDDWWMTSSWSDFKKEIHRIAMKADRPAVKATASSAPFKQQDRNQPTKGKQKQSQKATKPTPVDKSGIETHKCGCAKARPFHAYNCQWIQNKASKELKEQHDIHYGRVRNLDRKRATVPDKSSINEEYAKKLKSQQSQQSGAGKS